MHRRLAMILTVLFLLISASFYIITYKSFQATEIANEDKYIVIINIQRLIETFHITASLFFGFVITILVHESFKKSTLPLIN
jgi:hypothetical protein